jgi:hypothetical protein
MLSGTYTTVSRILGWDQEEGSKDYYKVLLYIYKYGYYMYVYMFVSLFYLHRNTYTHMNICINMYMYISIYTYVFIWDQEEGAKDYYKVLLYIYKYV